MELLKTGIHLFNALKIEIYVIEDSYPIGNY